MGYQEDLLKINCGKIPEKLRSWRRWMNALG